MTSARRRFRRITRHIWNFRRTKINARIALWLDVDTDLLSKTRNSSKSCALDLFCLAPKEPKQGAMRRVRVCSVFLNILLYVTDLYTCADGIVYVRFARSMCVCFRHSVLSAHTFTVLNCYSKSIDGACLLLRFYLLTLFVRHMQCTHIYVMANRDEQTQTHTHIYPPDFAIVSAYSSILLVRMFRVGLRPRVGVCVCVCVFAHTCAQYVHVYSVTYGCAVCVYITWYKAAAKQNASYKNTHQTRAT